MSQASPMRVYGVLLTAALSLSAATATRADERILSYDSVIDVRRDSTLEVTETIRVVAEGREIRRGIYRDFPTRYVDRRGERVVTGFELLAVLRDGRPEPHHTEVRANGVRVYAGDANVFLAPGEYTYQIIYRSDRQLGFFGEHDELYWNVTGNGWSFPIDTVFARVHLPQAVPRNDIGVEAYTGPQGARGQDWRARVDAGVPTFETTRSLGPGEGLTIVATWPAGYIAPPGPGARLRYLLRDAWPAVIGVGGLVLLLAYYLRTWFAVGRDPPGRIIVPHYEGPVGQSPASMRYLRQMKYDDRCFAAAVLSLAVKEQLAIEQSSAGLFGRSSDFVLNRQTPRREAPLSEDEQTLLERLFSQGPRLELDNENHSLINAAKTSHETVLKGRYTPSFFRINGGWHALGIGLSLLVGALAIVLPLARGGPDLTWFLTSQPGWLALGAVATGLLTNGLFGWLLKAPTIAGRAVMDRIEGFRLYLDVAEGDALKLVNAPPLTPELFEQNLPAALALDVEQRWAERFAGVFATEAAAYSPGWYSGDRWDTSSPGRFSSSFGSSFASAIASASSPPGSSSGSGGGGSSGGGGGGGGGGGW